VTQRDSVGEFEQLVMLAILRLEDDAYGVPIVEEIHQQTGRRVLKPAVYVALRRLEDKALITSWTGDATPERGGRAKRYYQVTKEGLERLRDSRRALLRMWKGLGGVLEGS